LAQRPVPDPTNEIGAIPQILADLLLNGRVVTVEAMHCQKEIAQTIVDRGGTT
jgi:predicted transposase YbfD/YdcC